MGEISYKQIVTSAISYIESNALFADCIDWVLVKDNLANSKCESLSSNDAYRYIYGLLEKLGDEHSHLITNDQAEVRFSSKPSLPSSSKYYTSRGTIGYIRIPEFIETSALSEVEFIDSIRQYLFDLNHFDLIGWVVDLRDNTGGNMWPMLAGLEGLLDGPCVGYFVNKVNIRESWNVHNGSAKIGDQVISASPYLRNLDLKSGLPVACLTNSTTCSSGEAIVVSLKGRNLTKQFGVETSGLSTANGGFQLPCGAMLWLTISVFADRNGVQYGEKIVPDTYVCSTTPDEFIFEEIANWMCESV